MAIEQVRLLYQTRTMIVIGAAVSCLAARAVWYLVPAWVIVIWLAVQLATALARLWLQRCQQRADANVASASRDATARQWRTRFVVSCWISGALWGAFGGISLVSSDPIYDVLAVFVLGGVIAASMISNAIYLPAFYGCMLPTALPAVVILIGGSDRVSVEMGVMLALFVVVLAVIGHNLNRSISDGISLLLKQQVLLAKLGRSEALMAEAQAIAHVGHWDFSEAANCFSVSDEATKIYGVDPARCNLSREAVLARIHPDDLAMVEKAYETAVAGHTSFGVDHRIVMDDGAIKFVHTAGRVFHDAASQSTCSMGTLQDITERKAVEARLQFANSLLTAEMEASPDGILVVDASRHIISHNQRFATMWGTTQPDLPIVDNEALLATLLKVIKDPAKFFAQVQYLYAHPMESSEDEYETLSGHTITRSTVPLHTESGEIPGRVWFFRDITARKTAEALVLRAARFDALTGLANRTIAVEAIELGIAKQKRGEQAFAVLYLDLDHFKDVNDTLGHPVGDALLCSVAARLRANTRATDTVARFGGDEFAIVVAEIQDPADAGMLADKLIHALGEPYVIEGNTIQCGVSIGIDFHRPDAADAEMLLSHADIALYRAKAEGRGTYRFFTEAMDAQVHLRVTLGVEFRAAFAAEQFFLLYQPQVQLETGRIVGVEALVRWQHPQRGVLGPDVFVPLAERVGLIRKLGHWVLWAACRQAKAWLDAGVTPIRMGVNLSALEFKTPVALENDVIAALAQTGLPPDHLELELTESVLMDASHEHNDVLQRLRRRGITVAIDDFGTGYSSLGYLSRFPSDRIKIAQNFIKDLAPTSENAAIVRATIGLGRDLGIMVIAEGIETREQRDLLKSWGCGEAQGYFYSRPLHPEAVVRALADGGIIQAAPSP